MPLGSISLLFIYWFFDIIREHISQMDDGEKVPGFKSVAHLLSSHAESSWILVTFWDDQSLVATKKFGVRISINSGSTLSPTNMAPYKGVQEDTDLPGTLPQLPCSDPSFVKFCLPQGASWSSNRRCPPIGSLGRQMGGSLFFVFFCARFFLLFFEGGGGGQMALPLTATQKRAPTPNKTDLAFRFNRPTRELVERLVKSSCDGQLAKS